MKRYLAINFSLYKLLPFCLVFFIQLSIQAQTRIEIPTDSNWARTLIDELEMMPDQMQTIDGGCTSPGHASGSKLYPDSDVVGYCANVQVAMHPSKK